MEYMTLHVFTVGVRTQTPHTHNPFNMTEARFLVKWCDPRPGVDLDDC